MSLARFSVLLLTLCLAQASGAEGYVIGIGADGDSADGRSIAAFGDFGIAQNTWLSVSANTARTDGFLRTNETVFADLGIDHWFDPVGIRLGGGYWGNPDILDARDLRASLYLRGDIGSVAVDYQKRNFEFDLQSDLLAGRTAKFDANGVGLSARIKLGDRVSLFASGMRYDYSRNLRVQPDIDVLAFLSRSRLSSINSLVDDKLNAGIEFRFGLRSLDLSAGRWQTAVDGAEINSFSAGFLTPANDRVDVEFRVSLDDSETFGRTTAFSFYVYYFGGT